MVTKQATGHFSRRRTLILPAVVSAAGVAGAACVPGGGSGVGGVPTPGTKQGVKVTIVNSAAGAVQAIFDRELRRFERMHPGVTAEYVSTQGQNHLEKIVTAFAGGTPY